MKLIVCEKLSPHMTNVSLPIPPSPPSLHPDHNVPDTGFSEEEMRSRNSIFVTPYSPEDRYGTR